MCLSIVFFSFCEGHWKSGGKIKKTNQEFEGNRKQHQENKLFLKGMNAGLDFHPLE